MPVGLDQVDSAITFEITSFWIRDDGNAMGFARIQSRLNDAFGDGALGIIRQDDEGGPSRNLMDGRNEFAFDVPVDSGDFFRIDAQQLLRSRHETGFQSGRPPAHGDQIGFDIRQLTQQGSQFPALVIITDDADQGRVKAKRGKVARHIPCTARHGCFACAAHDRNRRFRRDARDIAIDEPVQHDVADADNLPASRRRDKVDEGCPRHQPCNAPVMRESVILYSGFFWI